MQFEPYAIITSSYISVAILLIISAIVIFFLIYNRMNHEKSCKFNLISIVNDNNLRNPFGFLCIIIGFLIKYGARIPVTLYASVNDYISALMFERSIAPYLFEISEIFIFIGFSIVFWPTVLQVMYAWLGRNYPKKYYVNMAIASLIFLKLFLTVSGIIVYYSLTN